MKRILMFVFISLVTILVGCSVFTKDKTPETTLDKVPPFELEKEEPKPEKEVFHSPYTGEEIDNPEGAIPFLAIVENSKAARPQSGLINADIVFETMAEGGIPRFIALYYGQSADTIGPIRSARPYFVYIAEGFNLPLAHCGGSEKAISMINEDGVKTLNEFYNGNYYWRDNTRKAPHNLYTSTEQLKALIDKKQYAAEAKSALSFDNAYFQNTALPSAAQISIDPSGSYETYYEYKDGRYVKSMNDVVATDRETGEEISVANIIIQQTDMSLNENGVHIDIRLFGEGQGYLISQGRYEKITWRRDSSATDTVLYNEKGEVIPLSIGNSWWHIVDKNDKILINGN